MQRLCTPLLDSGGLDELIEHKGNFLKRSPFFCLQVCLFVSLESFLDGNKVFGFAALIPFRKHRNLEC